MKYSSIFIAVHVKLGLPLTREPPNTMYSTCIHVHVHAHPCTCTYRVIDVLAEAVELLQSCVPVSTENGTGEPTPEGTNHIPVVTGSLGGREEGRREGGREGGREGI